MCFPLVLRTVIYFHVYIIVDFPLTYRNVSVLCQSECACLHKSVNMVVFFVKSTENTYPKGRALIKDVQSCPYNEKRELRVSLFKPTCYKDHLLTVLRVVQLGEFYFRLFVEQSTTQRIKNFWFEKCKYHLKIKYLPNINVLSSDFVIKVRCS